MLPRRRVRTPMSVDFATTQCEEEGVQEGPFSLRNPRTPKECWYAVYGNWDGLLPLDEGECRSGLYIYCMETKVYDLCEQSGLILSPTNLSAGSLFGVIKWFWIKESLSIRGSAPEVHSSKIFNVPSMIMRVRRWLFEQFEESMREHQYGPNQADSWEPQVGEYVESFVSGPILSPSDCMEMAVRLGLKPQFEVHGLIMDGGKLKQPETSACERKGYAALWGSSEIQEGPAGPCDKEVRESESLYYNAQCETFKKYQFGLEEANLRPVESKETCIDLDHLEGYTYWSLGDIQHGPNLLSLDEKQCYEYAIYDGRSGLLKNRLDIDLPLYEECTDEYPVCQRFFADYPDQPKGCIRFWAPERTLNFANGTHLAPIYAFNRGGGSTCTHDVYP